MVYELRFEDLLLYDAGDVGITVPIMIRRHQDFVRLDAKLDTGASYCIFERAHGEQLGLDIESGHPERFGTAMGAFLAYGHAVTLSVSNFEFDIVAYFAADEAFIRNVLGRHGFLDRVLIGLDDYAGKFYLQRNGDDFETE